MTAIAPVPPVQGLARPMRHSGLALVRRLGADAISLSASQVAKRFFRLVVLLIAGRRLGPGLFGTYVLLLTVVEMVAVVSGIGYVDLLARDVAREHDWARRLLFRLTALRLLLTPIAAAILVGILWVLHYHSEVLINTGLLLLTLLPRSLNENCQGVLRGRSKFERLLWIEILQGITLLALLSFFLIVAHGGLRGAIYSELASSMLGSVVALVLAARFVKRANSITSLPPLRSAFAFNVFPLIVNVYDRVDVLILSKLAGDFAVGIYGIPYRLYTMLQILPYGLMGALLPGFSRTTWNPDSKYRCGKVLQVLYACALISILTLYFIAPPLLVLVLGARFRLSQLALRILAWAVIPMFLNSALNTILLADRREKVFIRTALICTVVNVVGNLLLVPKFSFVAAAGVTVVTECVLLVQNLFLVRRIIGSIPLPDLFVPLSISFVAVGGAVGLLKQIVPQMLIGILGTLLFTLLSYRLMRRHPLVAEF